MAFPGRENCYTFLKVIISLIAAVPVQRRHFVPSTDIWNVRAINKAWRSEQGRAIEELPAWEL